MRQVTVEYTTPNDFICRTGPDVADHCLNGQSCGAFASEGDVGAYTFNTTLHFMMAPVRNHTVPDTIKRCMNFALDFDMTAFAERVGLVGGVLGAPSTLQENIEFCNCVSTCTSACDLANKRTGFEYVGYIFAAWFVVSMTLCVCCTSERVPRFAQRVPPIVPALRSTLYNGPFQTLIPAWICDAIFLALFQSMIPFYVETVVAPEYMTMEDHGIDCYKSSPTYEGGTWQGLAGSTTSGSFDWKCRSLNVTMACGGTALICAIIALPLWNCVVALREHWTHEEEKKWKHWPWWLLYHFVPYGGKVNAWLKWSLTSGLTNALFLTVTPYGVPWLGMGGVWWVIIVAGLNGLPMGATFLAPSILSDIIDYDEFVTGQRREATYFMFRSLIPKVVIVPAVALPIAFLRTIGYRESVSGMPQQQSELVSYYIKSVGFVGFCASMLAYVFKKRYPLHKEKHLHEIRTGIALHKVGKLAKDPVTDNKYIPPEIKEGAEEELFWILGHFSLYRLQDTFDLPHEHDTLKHMKPKELHQGCKELIHKTTTELCSAFVFMVAMVVATAASLQTLKDAIWGFLPTVTMLVLGFSIILFVYCTLRRRAAHKLEHMVHHDEVNPLMVNRITHHAEIMKHKKEEKHLEEQLEIKNEKFHWLHWIKCSR